jgi:hypothetical protein
MPLFNVHTFLQTKTPIHLPHGKERKFPLELQEEKKKTRLDLCLERKEATSKVWTKKHGESSFGGKKKNFKFVVKISCASRSQRSFTSYNVLECLYTSFCFQKLHTSMVLLFVATNSVFR